MATSPVPRGEELSLLEDIFDINLVPTELFLKLRKENEAFRVGLNLQFSNFQGINDFHAKAVFKPLSPERRWKFMYEPLHGDICFHSKKISLTRYLNIQVGIGHNFHHNRTGWKWKLSSCFGGSGLSQMRHKTAVEVLPGVDFRFGWSAECTLPEIHGAMGTGEPIFNLNYGHFTASLDRIEVILTHRSDFNKLKVDQNQDVKADLMISPQEQLSAC